jgi:glycosyltransferase involved in cell wall biosynthesis
MKNNPLVSIIIPTYNRHKYLPNAIRSAINQTYKNIEIIVIDDCPKNPAIKIVEDIKDKRIQYYSNSKNK